MSFVRPANARWWLCTFVQRLHMFMYACITPSLRLHSLRRLGEKKKVWKQLPWPRLLSYKVVITGKLHLLFVCSVVHGVLAAGGGQSWTLPQQVNGSNCNWSLVKCSPCFPLMSCRGIIMTRGGEAQTVETLGWSEGGDEAGMRKRRIRWRRLQRQAAGTWRHQTGLMIKGSRFIKSRVNVS